MWNPRSLLCFVLTLLELQSETYARPSFSISERSKVPLAKKSNLLIRGGSLVTTTTDDDEDAEAIARQKQDLEKAQVRKWRMEQHQLLQLRSTFLSEVLAARGIPLTTMMDVATADGDKPPEEVDWDCAISTEDDPKTCLYSFDAQVGSKVVAPIGTTQYITLSALNRLRRTDPSKVEPMWHSKYAILQGWFRDESEYSFLQHVGLKGFVVSTLLLDLGNGLLTKSLLFSTVLFITVTALMPIFEFLMNRLLVSGLFWKWYPNWARIYHAAFPLKLLLAQMGWKFVAGKLDALYNFVRNIIVDMECDIFEETIPVTVGVEEPEAEEASFVTSDVEEDDGDEDFDSEESDFSDGYSE